MQHPEPAADSRGGHLAARPRVRIENTSGIGHRTKIYIDGVDVSDCFMDATVRLQPDHIVVADLTVMVAELDVDGARLVFPVDGTRELLVKHGWTPPPDEL